MLLFSLICFWFDFRCAASRVIKLLQRDAGAISSISPTFNQPNGQQYNAYHIRRGDFQQKHTRLPAEVILENTKHLLDTSKTTLLYIGSDERNLRFFDPFRKKFVVRTLNDYMIEARIGDENANHVGMIEQIVMANAYTFIGTPLSTFTNFITRMRGYYDVTSDPVTSFPLPSIIFLIHSRI